MSSQWLPSFCMALSGGHTSTRTLTHRPTLHGISHKIRKTHRNSLRISKTHISVNALDTNSSHPTNFQKNPKIAFIFLSFATGYVAMGMYEQPMSAMSCRNFLSSCVAYLPISLKTVRICLLFSNWTSLCSHDGWHKLHLLLNQLEWWSNPSVITSLTGYVADTLRHYATKNTKSARIVANSSYSSKWICFGHCSNSFEQSSTFHQVQDFGHSLWKLHAEREACCSVDPNPRFSQSKLHESMISSWSAGFYHVQSLLNTPDSPYSILILKHPFQWEQYPILQHCLLRLSTHSFASSSPTATFGKGFSLVASMHWVPIHGGLWKCHMFKEPLEGAFLQLEKNRNWRKDMEDSVASWQRGSGEADLLWSHALQLGQSCICFHDGMSPERMSGDKLLQPPQASQKSQVGRVRKIPKLEETTEDNPSAIVQFGHPVKILLVLDLLLQDGLQITGEVARFCITTRIHQMKPKWQLICFGPKTSELLPVSHLKISKLALSTANLTSRCDFNVNSTRVEQRSKPLWRYDVPLYYTDGFVGIPILF